MKRSRRPRPPVQAPSAFAGFRFPAEVILLAVRWYLRYALSDRDLEKLLATRGIDVDRVTLYRGASFPDSWGMHGELGTRIEVGVSVPSHRCELLAI